MTPRPRASEAAEEPTSSPPEPSPAEPAPPAQGSRHNRRPVFEVALGAKIRAARVGLGMSQIALGHAIDVSFQQVQKYERGADRIAASTLQSLGKALGVHPGWFFEEVAAPTGRIGDLREMLRAAIVLQRIRDPILREHLLALARRMAEVDGDELDAPGADP